MKTIKYVLFFIIFVVSLYYSQSKTILASKIWTFLYGNIDLYSFSFMFITLIYLIFLFSYFNLLNLNRKLSKFIVNKLFFFTLFIKLLNLLYDFYYYLFKFIQPIKVLIRVKLSKSDFIFGYLTKSPTIKYFRILLSHYASFLNSQIYELAKLIFGIHLKYFNYSSSERKFVGTLLSKAYSSPIYIFYGNNLYKLTIAEMLNLIYRIEYKFTCNNFKLIKNLIRLLKLLEVENTYFLYSNLNEFNAGKHSYQYNEFSEYENFSKQKKRRLFRREYRGLDSNKKYQIYKLLKIINYKPNKYRLFILMCLNKYFSKIKSFLKHNKLIISPNPNSLTKDSYYNSFFKKIEYNLYYIYVKELNLNKIYYNILINIFFKEMKIMFKFIIYFLIFYFLMFIINPIFINYFITFFIIISFFLKFLTYRNYNQLINLKYSIARLIYFKLCYSLYLLVLTNSFYIILINYFILTLLLIIIFSLNKAFFYLLIDDKDYTITPLILSILEHMIRRISIFLKLYKLKYLNYSLKHKYKYYYKAIIKYHFYKSKIIKFFKKN